MEVAVAWSGQGSRKAWDRGWPNQERMPQEDAQRVAQELVEEGHDAYVVLADMHLAERLEGLPRDAMVFNTAYGVQGAARYTHVPALLEMAGHRYTGSDPLAHALALEKPVAKTLLASHGVPTPAWRTVAPDEAVPPLDLGFPLVVKPVREGGSLGLALVHDREELLEAVRHVHDGFQQSALVERYVPGCDVMVPIIGNDALETLPAVQVQPAGEGATVLTQEAKEGRGQPSHIECPAPLDASTLRHAEAYSRLAFCSLGLSDWGRVDLRVTPDGQVHVLEVNSIPGLSATSSIRMAAEAAGLRFGQVLDQILEASCQRWLRRERRAMRRKVAPRTR